ncbi:Ketosamine-3-kinase [Coniochaeta ligniaria NRRL 30616]|uniref:protein-ribulosamine 3-kinase n=1 Tax=Coniochaeta ligniaria NRRL 30616 TaxID=1408157 RepID=A0A1J7IJ75_9PEZI|nr:Ketosamine-3-kinase [Coniochaeta ligniaria NRRL 30616]
MDLTKDPSLLSSLPLPPDSVLSVRQHGGSSFSSTWRLTASTPDGSGQTTTTRNFFVKTGVGPDAQVMFAGEHASLNAISDAVPDFCPRSHGHGELATAAGKFFLVTDFVELGVAAGTGSGSGESFARKLARLHGTPAPTPEGRVVYGFAVPTSCGSTVQDNGWRESWAEFFAENRLRGVLRAGEERNGGDAGLRGAVEEVVRTVVPRLLGDGHLKGVRPVVVHGDLWSGNHGRGRIAGGGVEEVVFDPSAVYGHSEYELGIMRMFGGYGAAFWEEYGELVPKSEPVEEWEDRLKLYELYHYLNHYAIFGGGYKSSAMSIMKSLISKYGS